VPGRYIGDEAIRAREHPWVSSELDALVIEDGEAAGVRIVGARHAGETFGSARLFDVELVRCDLSGCDFSESVWQRVTLTDCRATSLELAQSTLRDVTFSDCRVDDANFRMAKLLRTRFESCSLTSSDFGAAGLEHIAFPGCDLSSADLSQVRCQDVDLRDARLDGLKGVGSLLGATIDVDQVFGLAPALAVALGLIVRNER
jgi:uncharacterized protein YjbI with pentapeptide repeats